MRTRFAVRPCRKSSGRSRLEEIRKYQFVDDDALGTGESRELLDPEFHLEFTKKKVSAKTAENERRFDEEDGTDELSDLRMDYELEAFSVRFRQQLETRKSGIYFILKEFLNHHDHEYESESASASESGSVSIDDETASDTDGDSDGDCDSDEEESPEELDVLDCYAYAAADYVPNELIDLIVSYLPNAVNMEKCQYTDSSQGIEMDTRAYLRHELCYLQNSIYLTSTIKFSIYRYGKGKEYSQHNSGQNILRTATRRVFYDKREVDEIPYWYHDAIKYTRGSRRVWVEYDLGELSQICGVFIMCLWPEKHGTSTEIQVKTPSLVGSADVSAGSGVKWETRARLNLCKGIKKYYGWMAYCGLDITTRYIRLCWNGDAGCLNQLLFV